MYIDSYCSAHLYFLSFTFSSSILISHSSYFFSYLLTDVLPTIECPQPDPVIARNKTAVVTWNNQGYIAETDSPVDITCYPPSGYAFPPGETEIKCNETNPPFGKIGTCVFNVTVLCKCSIELGFLSLCSKSVFLWPACIDIYCLRLDTTSPFTSTMVLIFLS